MAERAPLPLGGPTPAVAARLRLLIRPNGAVWVAFVALLLGAALLRLVGIGWDEGQHLHPDERFLTQVETGLRWPEGAFLTTYFDEAKSTLNPRNVGFTFFAYGDFPIVLVKGVSVALGRTSYDQVYLVGRAMAALVDLGRC